MSGRRIHRTAGNHQGARDGTGLDRPGRRLHLGHHGAACGCTFRDPASHTDPAGGSRDRFRDHLRAPHRRGAHWPLYPGLPRRPGRTGGLGASDHGVRARRAPGCRDGPLVFSLFRARGRSECHSCRNRRANRDRVVGCRRRPCVVSRPADSRQKCRWAPASRRFGPFPANQAESREEGLSGSSQTLVPGECNRQENGVLRALPGIGRVERLVERVSVRAATAAAYRDRWNLEADRQVGVGRSFSKDE